jgi:hypothetical protein
MEATTQMQTKVDDSVEVRIKSNPHFATLLRKRLESRHGKGAVRERLARMSDAELIEVYLNNERQGREHAAQRRAAKESIE